MRTEDRTVVPTVHPRFGRVRQTFRTCADVPALATLGNGTYRVQTPDGHIHFFVQADPADATGGEGIFVFFHGAVSGRTELPPPFFSGLGIQKKIGSGPLVAFSDPVVESDPACSLGWFAGSAGMDVTRWSATIVHQLVKEDPRKTWLVGGSGGGFAALNIGYRLGAEVSVLAWNPQTIVANYSPGPVRKYLEVAFPRLVSDLNEMPVAKVCRKASRLYGRDLELGSVIASGSRPRNVLVLQNYDDWHVRPHTAPLVNWLGLNQRSAGLFDDGDGVAVWLPEMGVGHAAPDTDRLAVLLRVLVGERYALADTVRHLDDANFFPSTDRGARPMDLRTHAPMLLDSLRVELEADGVRVVSDLVVAGQHGLAFHYTKYRQDSVVASSGWVDSMSWVPGPSDFLRVGDTLEVGLRDGFGHVLGSVKHRL